jgi:hypothetical protein
MRIARSRLRHLTARDGADSPERAMSTLRALFVALISLSVAVLPVAGSTALAFSPGTTIANVLPDCCLNGECKSPMQGGCAKFAGCEVKCSSLVALDLPPSQTHQTPATATTASLIADKATSRSHNPPSPPPRA